MNKLLFVFSLVILSGIGTVAQSTDDYRKSEDLLGYSHGQVDGSTFRFAETSRDFRETGPLKFHGFSVSGVYNVARYVGIKADVSGTYHGGDFRIPINPTTAITGEGRNALYN